MSAQRKPETPTLDKLQSGCSLCHDYTRNDPGIKCSGSAYSVNEMAITFINSNDQGNNDNCPNSHFNGIPSRTAAISIVSNSNPFASLLGNWNNKIHVSVRFKSFS